ncbi:hypothetical protein SOVF_088300 [Spinacia oleracea]|uniref:Transmembrane protein n=1 Tax=Spinacia oleracea TaxID=3562 RepID=A0A9R0JZY2_SPIOL|nr:uncharacterized protein LOC110792211 [Spinacia oleracea]KNA16546.1 hypothetical protein SOVF_088300 [Spinacia oleracea]
MSCIHSHSPSLHLLNLQKHKQNAEKSTNLQYGFFSSYSAKRHCNIISKVAVLPLNVETFHTSLTLAVAKPANTEVLFQTSALLIFFYLVANFVVPQLITKGFGGEGDENEKPNNSDSVDELKVSSTATKRGFNNNKLK